MPFVEEGLVRLLELLLHVLRPLAAVDVVADGDHELEGKSLVHLGHLLAELILHPIAGTEIAEHRELERAFTIGQRDLRLRRLAGCRSGSSGQSRGAGRAGKRRAVRPEERAKSSW